MKSIKIYKKYNFLKIKYLNKIKINKNKQFNYRVKILFKKIN